MSFLSPIAALLAGMLAIPALILLYFLKLKRQQVTISSTLLWQKAIEDMQVNAPFQKLRKNLLLLIQLFILLLILIAIARPVIQGLTLSGKRMVIMIDHSASMNAVDVGPSRLANAKKIALMLVDQNESQGGVMVVSFAGDARVRQPFTTDLTRLKQAIGAIDATDQKSRFDRAIDLLKPFSKQQRKGMVVYVISDGMMSQSRENMAPRGAVLHYVQVGETDASKIRNVGIVNLSARRDEQNLSHLTVFMRVTNMGPRVVDTTLKISLDNQITRVLPISIPPAKKTLNTQTPGEQTISFDLNLTGAAVLNCQLDYEDQLALDNQAALVIATPKLFEVMVVTSGNPYLKQVFQAIGVKQIHLVTPQAYQALDRLEVKQGGWQGPASRPIDVVVFDRYTPTQLPFVPSLSFAGSLPIQGFRYEFSKQVNKQSALLLDWRRRHRLLRYVSLEEVRMTHPDRLILPPHATWLATSADGPVMASMVDADRQVRHVVVAFDLFESNWPILVSFPVFMSNSLQWLCLGNQQANAVSYRPGDVVSVRVSQGLNTLRYRGPILLEAPVIDGQAVLPKFTRVGVYHPLDGVKAPSFAVNLVDKRESNILPHRRLLVGAMQANRTPDSQVIRREIWQWFIWIAFVGLLVEWVIYTRRMHL